PTPPAWLLLDGGEVRGQVDAGEGDRDVRLVAEGGRRAHDRNRAGVRRFELACRLAFHRGGTEIDRAGVQGGRIRDRKGQELRGRLGRGPPAPAAARVAEGFAVGPAGRARRGRECGDLEPRVTRERDKELLPGDPGGSDDGDPT